MAYKDKEKELEYYRKYYLEKKKPKYVPHPRVLQTKEEKLAKRKAYRLANVEKAKQWAKASRERHKEQRAIDIKNWIAKNKDKQIAYHKEYNQKWYQENKSKKDAQNKEWAKRNPDRAKAIKEKFLENNPEKVKEFFKKYNLTLHGRFNTLKGSAKQRGIYVSINLEQFKTIVENPCAYCGESETRIGVDRIDNTKGYIENNCAPCCKTCNMMKKDMEVDEFLQHINKINKYHGYLKQ